MLSYTDGATILFQGDSITDGNRYKTEEQRWDKNHQMGHSYAYVVNALLGSLHPEMRLKFVNRGVSGNGIKDIYARRKEDIFDIMPDIFSLLVGVNDATKTEPEEFERVYSELLFELREVKADVKIVLLEPFFSPSRDDYSCCMPYISRYQQSIRRLAEEYDATFVPLHDALTSVCVDIEPEYWLWDGIHPTESGHGKIARLWIEAVAPELCRIFPRG